MKTLLLFMILLFFFGCATVAPPELDHARAAYKQANAGPAARLALAELHRSATALAVAEQSFARTPIRIGRATSSWKDTPIPEEKRPTIKVSHNGSS